LPMFPCCHCQTRFCVPNCYYVTRCPRQTEVR
jgi:hypothetical protein